MTKDELLNAINEIMQREEPLTDDMLLSSLEDWDSMSVLSVMTLFDTEFQIVLTTEHVMNAKTVADLISLAKDKLT
ncbi:hypothetical protein PN36_17485 [Candidatus Thiomargarita nelsonii]|uniref:Carrier domain-containing protein n=1 Tax=Candidatus Thiomargarita nelsonii TaxID=1003181 RepID=A0A0A6P6M0_9GAMM|nr:hypothetical protein PN36_17485 [Candidatus Thiomargarita nelsonii]